MFENGLYELLTTSPGVSGLVGTSIHFTVIPKGATFPSIVIHTLSTNFDVDLISTAALQERRLQINFIASTDQFDAREGERAVQALLEDYSGTLPDGTVVSTAIVNNVFDLPYEIGGLGFAKGSALDISFWITEATS
jgi:uncharacterized protein DUF3168